VRSPERPARARTAEPARRPWTPEVGAFLAVGGTGFVVDVVAFNLLRSVQPFESLDPTVARSLAMVAAMCVTYLGNRHITWRRHTSSGTSRELILFALLNLVGLGFSVAALALSHDVLGLTSRLADNISANGVGLALGTLFRYVTYRTFVFAVPSGDQGPGPDERSSERVPVG